MAQSDLPDLRLTVRQDGAGEGILVDVESRSGPVALLHQLGPVVVDEPLASQLTVRLPDPARLDTLRLRVIDQAPPGDDAHQPWRFSRSAVRAVLQSSLHRPLEFVPELGPRGAHLIELAPGHLDALDEPTRPHEAGTRPPPGPSDTGAPPPVLVRHLRRELTRAQVQIQHLAAAVAESRAALRARPAAPAHHREPLGPDDPTRRR